MPNFLDNSMAALGRGYQLLYGSDGRIYQVPTNAATPTATPPPTYFGGTPAPTVTPSPTPLPTPRPTPTPIPPARTPTYVGGIPLSYAAPVAQNPEVGAPVGIRSGNTPEDLQAYLDYWNDPRNQRAYVAPGVYSDLSPQAQEIARIQRLGQATTPESPLVDRSGASWHSGDRPEDLKGYIDYWRAQPMPVYLKPPQTITPESDLNDIQSVQPTPIAQNPAVGQWDSNMGAADPAAPVSPQNTLESVSLMPAVRPAMASSVNLPAFTPPTQQDQSGKSSGQGQTSSPLSSFMQNVLSGQYLAPTGGPGPTDTAIDVGNMGLDIGNIASNAAIAAPLGADRLPHDAEVGQPLSPEEEEAQFGIAPYNQYGYHMRSVAPAETPTPQNYAYPTGDPRYAPKIVSTIPAEQPAQTLPPGYVGSASSGNPVPANVASTPPPTGINPYIQSLRLARHPEVGPENAGVLPSAPAVTPTNQQPSLDLRNTADVTLQTPTNPGIQNYSPMLPGGNTPTPTYNAMPDLGYGTIPSPIVAPTVNHPMAARVAHVARTGLDPRFTATVPRSQYGPAPRAQLVALPPGYHNAGLAQQTNAQGQGGGFHPFSWMGDIMRNALHLAFTHPTGGQTISQPTKRSPGSSSTSTAHQPRQTNAGSPAGGYDWYHRPSVVGANREMGAPLGGTDIAKDPEVGQGIGGGGLGGMFSAMGGGQGGAGVQGMSGLGGMIGGLINSFYKNTDTSNQFVQPSVGQVQPAYFVAPPLSRNEGGQLPYTV